jgi:hypothetical protein
MNAIESKVGFTPGPWEVDSIRTRGTTAYVIAGEGAIDGEAEANCRLIEAATELLAALRRAVPWLGKLIADGAHLNSVAPNDAIGALEQAEAAIAKAT